MNKEAEVRTYFGQPAFTRFLAQLRAKYESSTAGARGYVALDDPTEEERAALDGFYGTYSVPARDKKARYRIKEFEQLLLRSRFGLTIPELLAIIGGAPARTRLERRTATDAAWERMIAQAAEVAGTPLSERSRLAEWVEGLRHETAPGARTLRRVFANSQEEAGRNLKLCLVALRLLPGGEASKPIRLPILSARVTGDAHALDWKQPLGRLFWWGIAALYGQESVRTVEDEEAEEAGESVLAGLSGPSAILIREVYRKGGVADDDLSSQDRKSVV